MAVVGIDHAAIVVRRPRPTDQSFIAATWVDSWQTGDPKIPRSTANQLVDRLLDDATVRILIACEPTNADKIIGWLCYTPLPRVLVVHYAYVRGKMRRRGIGGQLIHTAQQAQQMEASKPVRKIAYTMDGPSHKWLAEKYRDAIRMELAEFLG